MLLFWIAAALTFSAVFIVESSAVNAQSTYRVEGTLYQSSGQPAADQPVVLLEITMSETPTVEPVRETRTGTAGDYRFSVIPTAKNVFYRVSARVRGQEIGSEPFRLSENNAVETVDLHIPDMYEGIHHLVFQKEIIIIDTLEEAVRITEIIAVENPKDGMVNAKKIPFKMKLPNSARNFQQFERRRGVDVRVEQGYVIAELSLPPGRSQIVFAYEIPAANGSLNLENHMPPGLNALEVTTADEHLIINPDISNLAQVEITQTEKKVGQRIYYSKIISPVSNQESIPIRIENIPLSQKRAVFPAVFLLAVLIAGFYVYLLKRGRRVREETSTS